jgi:DNA-binding MarR family transcriptional regulator
MARRLRQEGVPGRSLSLSQSSALGTINMYGPLTPSKLAEREQLARPGVTRMLARLESAGLVRREDDVDDGRSYLVSVTPLGKAVMNAARERSNAYLAAALESCNEEELAALEAAAQLVERILGYR